MVGICPMPEREKFMTFLKYLIIAFAAILLPMMAIAAGIPGLEGLREVSDDDLEEICGSIMPDDKSQMILSRRATPGSQQGNAAQLGDQESSTGAGALPGAPSQGGFDVKAYAQSIAGNYVTADVNTSGLQETVTPHSNNLSDMLTPGNVLNGGAFGGPAMGMDYAASGVVEISGPKVMGMDMSQMGDMKAAMGVRVSATISVVP